MLVSVIVVNFNGGDLLTRCLRSLREGTAGHPVEIIVVDNGSSDDSVDSVPPDLRPDRLIRSPNNLGFAQGNNLGAAQARGEYLLLVNTDCFLAPDSLTMLLERITSDDRIAVVAPRLCNGDGSLQRSCHGFPGPMTLFLEQSSLWRLVKDRRLGDRLPLAGRHDRARQADWVAAACWLVRRSAWDEADGFDPAYLFYWDEIDLCRRLDQLHWQVWFEPAAGAMHLGGGSTDGPVALPEFFRGLYRYYSRFHSRSAQLFARLLVRGMAVIKTRQHRLRSRRATSSEERHLALRTASAWSFVARM
ncbi:MAG: glycosyltransferase family 2 protein [Jatrophihabitans sp.]|uniref:glycosyltransferase family 2 protein n=1 Tax=Jatrophihabitans sp. TaxID=1932789 RepID=UPI003F804E7C